MKKTAAIPLAALAAVLLAGLLLAACGDSSQAPSKEMPPSPTGEMFLGPAKEGLQTPSNEISPALSAEEPSAFSQKLPGAFTRGMPHPQMGKASQAAPLERVEKNGAKPLTGVVPVTTDPDQETLPDDVILDEEDDFLLVEDSYPLGETHPDFAVDSRAQEGPHREAGHLFDSSETIPLEEGYPQSAASPAQGATTGFAPEDPASLEGTANPDSLIHKNAAPPAPIE